VLVGILVLYGLFATDTTMIWPSVASLCACRLLWLLSTYWASMSEPPLNVLTCEPHTVRSQVVSINLSQM